MFSFFRRRKPARAVPQPLSFRPSLEALEDRLAPAVQGISFLDGPPVTPGNATSYTKSAGSGTQAMSTDGNIVVSETHSDNLIAGDTNNVKDVAVKKMATGEITVVSARADGAHGGPAAFAIKDFSFGVENPSTIGSATGGAGAGKIKFNEFSIKKTTDRASPAFFKNWGAGAPYDEVFIEMRKAVGDPASSGKSFLKFKFDTVFTTKLDWTGRGNDGPEESITFVYGKLGVKYSAQAGGKTDTTWVHNP